MGRLGTGASGTTISEVTDEDVRLRTWNIWDSRGDWDLTDEEWEEMLARLEPLGLGELEEGGFWDRWVVSGKEPAPSASGGREPGHEMLRWSAEVEGLQLFAIADEEGVVEQVYGSVQPLWAPSRPHDLLLRPVSLPTPYFPAIFHFRTGPLDVALLDLATLTFHQVDGLSMRTEDLFAARPAPAPAEAARPAVDYEPLTMGEPRPLPAGDGGLLPPTPLRGRLGYAQGRRQPGRRHAGCRSPPRVLRYAARPLGCHRARRRKRERPDSGGPGVRAGSLSIDVSRE